MKYSYDYEDLLSELKSDVWEGLIKEDVFIVRSDKSLSDGYRPIVDYYYIEYVRDIGEDDNDKLKLIKKNVLDVIKEMEEKNRLI